MSDIFGEITNIAKSQWQKPTDSENVKAELVRRFGSAWELATMGFCTLHSGEETYTALIADSPEETSYIFLQFIVVEWTGSEWLIHQTINTDGSDGSEAAQ